MADTLIDGSASTDGDVRAGLWGPYWIDALQGAMVLLRSNDVYIYRTSDGGASWDATGTSNIFTTAFAALSLAVFFDREVPGDTGTLLHIWILNSNTTGNLVYRNFDIDADSLGSEVNIVGSIFGSLATFFGSYITGCKTRNGNLLCGAFLQNSGGGTTARFVYRSTDGGASWSARTTTPFEDPGDVSLLLPANTGDGADACMIYYDASAAALSTKIYDDSADTWTETAIGSCSLGSLTSSANPLNHFDASTRHSDGLIALAAWTQIDNAAADLLTWTINPNSVGSPTVTAKANVLTDTAESGGCAVAINQENDDVAVAYLLGGTWQSTVDVKFKISTDDLASFGTQQNYSETTDDYRRVAGPRSISDDHGRIQWSWFDDDDNDVFVNLVNDIDTSISRISLAGSLPAMSGVLEFEIFPGTIEVPLAGSLPSQSGVVAATELVALAGSLPAQSGGISLRAFIDLLGSLPAQSGVVTKQYSIALAGALPSQSGVVVQVYSIALAGSLPSQSGVLSLLASIALAGSLPSQSGVVAREYHIALLGSLPSQSGVLSLKAYLDLVGSLPSQSGVVEGGQGTFVAGALPSQTGTLSLQATIALLGSLPAQSGVVAREYHIMLLGTLPAQSGALSLIGSTALLGSLPSQTGNVGYGQGIFLGGSLPSQAGVLSLEAFIDLLGSLPTQTGDLAAVSITTKSLTGSLPNMTGALSLLGHIALTGNLPSQSGVISLNTSYVLLGELPGQSGVVVAILITGGPLPTDLSERITLGELLLRPRMERSRHVGRNGGRHMRRR